MRLAPVVFLLCGAAHSAALPTGLYDALQWRMIGPFRGGRVSAVSGVPGDATTFYFGSVGGGIWKTTNGGITWLPIFDGQPVASIGALAVAASNPYVIYAGTGEADIRSQIGFGDGVYRSTDAGRTWRNVGLRDSRQIGQIAVDPHNPDLVYVAALGHVYGPNAERGVFRSSDGGATWNKVLDRGPETGAVDIALDPQNPRTLYATVWNAHRPPWSTYAPIEGPGSGLFKSTDGGDHWTQVAGHGLPESQWGRSGVAIVPGGRRVYVVIDAAAGGSGLYRSDDAGATWTRTSTDSRLTSRAWYFSQITADPKNPDVIYAPNVGLNRSIDGGRTFSVIKGAPGGDDYRIVWVDPTEPKRLIQGADQGTSISVDGGLTWSSWYNQPTAQLYHVTTDNQFPYHVYGSQQDSGTSVIPSRGRFAQIDAREWYSVGGAEAGYIAVDPKSPNIVYVNDANGSLARFDKRTSQSQNITPWPAGSGGPTAAISMKKYRNPWTSPLVFSPLEPNTLYFGAQYLLKTIDGGLTWQEISGDLTGDTRKDRAPASVPVTPENARELGYGVIYTIAPSSLSAGLIWVGSDTGLIHLTRDGGKTWSNVTPPNLPVWSKVTQIEASHFEAGTAWAAVDRHRREDYRPYVYRTHDFGKTWTLAAEGLSEPAYLNSIKEDPARKGLLYAATELGMAVSFDDAAHWQALQLNLPAVSVRDIAVHGDDVVIATHGRGFWILDNATVLQQIDERTAASDAVLFKPATAVRFNPDSFFGTPLPPEEPQAKNPPDGAVIDFYLKSAPGGEVRLDVLDAKGEVVRSFSTAAQSGAMRRPQPIADYWLTAPARLSARAGMNRFEWDLRYAPPEQEGSTKGPQALPGTYTVRLTVAGRTLSQPLKIVKDPRSTALPLELQKRFDLSIAIWRDLRRAAEVSKLAADKRQAGTLSADAAAIAGVTGGGRGGGGRAASATGPTIASVMTALNTALEVAESADRTPPAAAYEIARQAARDLNALLAKWKALP